MRIPYEVMKGEFQRVLMSRGFDEENAVAAATVFAQNSLDGIHSHGLNRFPVVVDYLDRGKIDPQMVTTCEMAMGAIERWNGHRGFGPLNAKKAMDRACQLAKEHGIGLVALGNNNHWMRGGTYGRLAADQGCIGICWSNTTPNMPAWGGVDPKLGNNPLIFAVPKTDGNHVVVDCALSQFSFGKMEETRLKGEQLPVVGGYDQAGELTTEPSEIELTRRTLPMGYWKGSGISILLDLITTSLTGALSVHEIGQLGEEIGLSQIMIAIDVARFETPAQTDAVVEAMVADLKCSIPTQEGTQPRFPGEREFKVRHENLELGIPVIQEKWNQVLSF